MPAAPNCWHGHAAFLEREFQLLTNYFLRGNDNILFLLAVRIIICGRAESCRRDASSSLINAAPRPFGVLISKPIAFDRGQI